MQLVEGIRDPSTGKVKQKVIRHIGSASTDEDINRLRELGQYIKYEIDTEYQASLLSAEETINMSNKCKVYRSRAHGESKEVLSSGNENYSIDDFRNLREERKVVTGIHEVYGHIYEQLSFNRILQNPARNKHSTEIIRDIVLGRIASPASKRETVNFLADDYGISLNLDSVYKAMDKLDDVAVSKLQSFALDAAKSLFKEKIDVLFYDATTLYFESFTEDELKSKGFSKDNKFNEMQIMLSIFVTQAGIPVGYEIFPGSTYEGHTLITALDNLGKRFEINKVVFVADSGLLSKENIAKLEKEGYQYIVGARIKNMASKVTKEILDKDSYEPLSYNSDEGYSYKIIELGGEQRLLVNHSALRARKDGHDRDKAIKKLMDKMSKSNNVKSLINDSGYKKYLAIGGDSLVEVDEEKIEEDKRWDGLQGVITNIKDFDPGEIIKQYRGLWQVEETFRLSKHDLKVRPIYHWTPKRIRAHIAICFMALTCVRHLEYRVNLQGKKMSPERIRKALTGTGITVVKHIKDKRNFAIPFKVNDDAKIIYKVINKTLSDCPYIL